MPSSIEYLRNRINLRNIPFTERGSRIMVLRENHRLLIQLAESWSEDAAPTLLELELMDIIHGSIIIETMPHQVAITTMQGTWILGFADTETLLLQLPPQSVRLRLITGYETWQPDQQGGVFHYTAERPLQVTYTTNAQLTQQKTLPHNSTIPSVELTLQTEQFQCCLSLNITRKYHNQRILPQAATVFKQRRQAWETWLDAVPSVPLEYRPQYYFAWWIIGVNLIHLYSHPQQQGMIPAKRGYVGVWNWDSYFHVLALRHAQPELARDQFRILFAHQQPNGMLPDVVQDEGALTHTTDYSIDADITKPPLTAWALWKLYETDHDAAFLHEMYAPLVRSQQWWFAEHDADGNGLCEYAHPYSSGLDNSPLFDQGVPLETPDLNAYLILQYDHLAKIAQVLGLVEDAERWTQAATKLAQHLIDLRWDATAGYFWAWRHNQAVRIRTPFNLFPLITGRMPSSIAHRLVRHLTDPDQYWTQYPVPTVAVNDPTHNASTMWRGPVWINVNYLLIDGLRRAGFTDIARELRQKTLALLLKHRDICEYYHPQTGEKPPKAVSAFGWSAALFIDLLLNEELS